MRAAHRFTGTWTVPADLLAVQHTITDLERYPEWWPQVRAVARLGPDDARVLCRATLPYTLDLVLHAVSREAPVLEVAVSGDLEGSVRWRLTEVAGGTRLELGQEVEVSGALAAASYAVGPLLRWNHQRMMAGGISGLTGRLLRPSR